MSTLLTPPLSTPPAPRVAQIKQQALNIRRLSRESYETITRIQQRGIDALWNHPELTPQEIIDGLGADAIKVFQYHGALTNYLVTLAQTEGITPDIKLPTNAFTIDMENGTITVTEDPYVP